MMREWWSERTTTREWWPAVAGKIVPHEIRWPRLTLGWRLGTPIEGRVIGEGVMFQGDNAGIGRRG